MATAAACADLLTTRDIADRFDCALHQVVTVVDRIGLGQKVGRFRIIRAEDLGRVELGLRAAGFLKRQGAAPQA